MTPGAVYLHVGAPKSGTTYLQDRLGKNVQSLAEHAVHVPTVSPLVSPARAQFRAALDLLEQDWGGRTGHAAGYWERLAARVRRTTGTAVISHEILAPAPAHQIARALSDLSAPHASDPAGGHEVHIVYTARDLARGLASAWQESIKQGRSWTFRAFLNRARRGRSWFMRALDVPAVLGAWGQALPKGRVHLVTLPQGGAGESESELWRRFCEALSVSPDWAPRPAARTNPSLGAAETALLRRLNLHSGAGVRDDGRRDRYVDALFGNGSQRAEPRVPIRLPPQDLGWVRERTRDWLDQLAAQDVVVHGSLDDLMPPQPPAHESWSDPDQLPAEEVLDAALERLHDLASARRDRLWDRATASRLASRFF